ncbi:hypothetical protein ES705_07710 [subsurface metagenome]
MKRVIKLVITISAIAIIFSIESSAQIKEINSTDKKPAAPIIVNGETQIVPEFKDPDMWIRHDLWVETEFDSDGDGKLDRMHVDVTRPRQTDITVS